MEARSEDMIEEYVMIAMFTKMKVLAVAGVAAAGLMAGTQTASAHDRWSVGVSLGFPFFTPAAPAPVVVAAPAPVYCPPTPIVVAPPAPVYAVPQPVYAAPVYVQPTVVVAPPIYPGPVVVSGPGFARPYYGPGYGRPGYRYNGGYYYHR